MPKKQKNKKAKFPNEIEDISSRSHPDFQEALKEFMKIIEEARATGHKISPNIAEMRKYRDAFKVKIKSLPKGAFLQMDDYEDRIGVSYAYGYYPRTKPVLDIFWYEYSGMDDNGFFEILKGPLARLASDETDIYWASFLLPFREHYGSMIIRIIVFAVRREKALELIEEEKEEIPSFIDVESLQYNVLMYLGQKLGSYLEGDGVPTLYPRPISGEELEKMEDDPRKGKLVGIDLQFARKDLKKFGYIDYIKEKSESPIESRLAGALVLHGLLPILNVEVVDPEYPGTLTRADLVIMSDPEPLLIYADSAKHHSTPIAQTHDKRVDRRLQELGFQILRVSGSDIYSNIERTVEDIKGRLFGRGAHILPEGIWKPKILKALKKAKTCSDQTFLRNMLKHIERGKRITVKQEVYLNKVCNRLGISRPYEWLDLLKPNRIQKGNE